jgi:hypothetical protein
MDKSIQINFFPIHSPRFKPWAIDIKMDKSIHTTSFTTHNPPFKPWAMRMREITQNRFNGLNIINEN